MNLKKIIREEIGLEWMMEDWIEGKELRSLLLQTGAETIPFREVRGNLDLNGIKIKDLGNLQRVDGFLDLEGTPISEMYSEREIRAMVRVEGDIYF